jgi:diguanylate cyclase (GGDEF)-like protein
MIQPFDLDIFSRCSEHARSLLSAHSRLRSCNLGDVVIENGAMGKDLFFVLSGKVTASIHLPGQLERRQGEFSAGDFFGESSVFGAKPSFMTYSAADNCMLFVVDGAFFSLLIEENPEEATLLVSTLLSRTISRFRSSSRFLADVVQWGERASRRVITDELTGIYNRAFLEDALENFFNISKSNNKPLSLLMLDLDNCRKINTELDLDAGNHVIREFAAIIKRIVSQHGVAARYGGDEFAILLPETDSARAGAIAEEIRSAVETHDFSKILRGADIAVTTSIGVSSFPESTIQLASFKETADAALYRAKEAGRNRVSF